MPDILILYWQPGSCGDFVQSLLLDDPIQYDGVITQFSSTKNGRIVPAFKPEMKEVFKHSTSQWYCYNWTKDDCSRLMDVVDKLTVDKFIIPTHQFDQVCFLKEQFSNSISVGITYPTNMFPTVLKNWCKKVVTSDVTLDKIYNQPLHQHLKKNKIFGEFILKEQIKFGCNIRSCVDDCFDISLPLEDLYVFDTTMLKPLIGNFSKLSNKIQHWLSLQNLLPQYQLDNTHPIIKNALGFNSKAKKISERDLQLDLFDNILIREFCRDNTPIRNLPLFHTLKDAEHFFNNINDS